MILVEPQSHCDGHGRCGFLTPAFCHCLSPFIASPFCFFHQGLDSTPPENSICVPRSSPFVIRQNHIGLSHAGGRALYDRIPSAGPTDLKRKDSHVCHARECRMSWMDWGIVAGIITLVAVLLFFFLTLFARPKGLTPPTGKRT